MFLAGRPEFREAAMLFWYQLSLLENTDGLYCVGFDGASIHCAGNRYSWGSAADSAYEYMLKQWVLSAGQDEVRDLDHFCQECKILCESLDPYQV
jgi:mannosyl-oligosaccharide alpha-1,2-mannosidase